VLRREGIYSSHISAWRQRRDGGGKAALDRKRGPKPNPQKSSEFERLRRENQRWLEYCWSEAWRTMSNGCAR
jgi:transposase